MSRTPKLLSVFGSTGSIGTQTLEVVSDAQATDLADEISLYGLVANSSLDDLVGQVKRFSPKVVGLYKSSLYRDAKEQMSAFDVEVVCGEEIYGIVSDSDIVMNAVTGFSGVRVTEQALVLGKRLANANKESIVAAGDLVEIWRQKGNSELIPVDSEHSAIFQVLSSSPLSRVGVKQLVVTASGGPFRSLTKDELDSVTLDEALRHPTWNMGPKNTIDSSTLANKGLEVIEAHYLFGVDYDNIEVVIHPQSIVHSMVEYQDGTVLAQVSMPDMKLPISLAIFYPKRSIHSYGAMDWKTVVSLEFEPPDHERFPALKLAYRAGSLGSGGTCWYNAANEVAVKALVDGVISWKDVAKVLELSMDRYEQCNISSVDDVMSVDGRARSVAHRVVEEIT